MVMLHLSKLSGTNEMYKKKKKKKTEGHQLRYSSGRLEPWLM